MKTLLITLSMLSGLCLGGCNSKGVDRLLGNSDKSVHQAQFFTVSCCRDTNNGIMTYPSFLPASHVSLCEAVRQSRDGQLNGDTYLAMGSDCGHGHHSIGDQFYPAAGY